MCENGTDAGGTGAASIQPVVTHDLNHVCVVGHKANVEVEAVCKCIVGVRVAVVWINQRECRSELLPSLHPFPRHALLVEDDLGSLNSRCIQHG